MGQTDRQTHIWDRQTDRHTHTYTHTHTHTHKRARAHTHRSRFEAGFRSGCRCRRVGGQRTEEQARSGFRSGVRGQRVENQGRRGTDQAQEWSRPGPGVLALEGRLWKPFLGYFPVALKWQGKFKKKKCLCNCRQILGFRLLA